MSLGAYNYKLANIADDRWSREYGAVVFQSGRRREGYCIKIITEK